ncbi:MAG: XylR family transcriptional regulator [Kiritimatiellia bacterium]
MKRTVRNKMPQVAVLLESSHETSRAMLQGILQYVRAHGPWSISTVLGGADDQRVPDTDKWKGDGIIGRIPNDTAADAIIRSELPAVIFNPYDRYLERNHPLSYFFRVQCNSHEIGTLAADFLLGRNTEHFAYVGWPEEINWSRWRYEAFTKRLKQNNRKCHFYPQPPCTKTDWNSERSLLCRWLKKLPKPAAVFAANDNRARQVLDACLFSGIAVPYELTVLGVNNDTLVCETCIPTLSSININNRDAGYKAAEMLDFLMQGRKPPERIATYGTGGITERASTEELQVSDPLVIKALEYIRINGGLNIRVSDVAAYLDVTPRWAENRFKDITGNSLHKAIHKARMKSICSLLRETEMSLTDMARRCGFSRLHHLCDIFKKEFGITMSEYRKKG